MSSAVVFAASNVSSAFSLLVPLLVAIVAAVGAFFAARTGNKKTQEGLHEVHVLVNSQLTRVMARVDQLETLLTQEGIRVPEKDSTEELLARVQELEQQLGDKVPPGPKAPSTRPKPGRRRKQATDNDTPSPK